MKGKNGVLITLAAVLVFCTIVAGLVLAACQGVTVTRVLQWSTPVSISAGSGDASQRPRMTAGSNGQLYAVWMDGVLDSATGPMFARGEPWQAWEWVNGHVQPGYVNPAVAVDNAGTVYVAWAGLTKSPYSIYVASKPAGGAWSAPVKVSASTTNCVYPDLAVDSSGRLWMVWQDSVTDVNGEIYAATKPAGGAWVVIQVTSNAYQDLNPRLALDAASTVHLVWRSNGLAASPTAVLSTETVDHPAAGNWEVMYAKWNGSGFTVPLNLSATGNSSHFPAIAATTTGLYVTWEENNDPANDGWQTLVRRYNGNAWLLAIPASHGAKALYPSVAADGVFVAVVWVDYRSGTQSYYNESRDGGVTWGVDTLISGAVKSAYYPSVVVLAAVPRVVFQGGTPLDVWYTTAGAVTPTVVPTVPPTPLPTLGPTPPATCPALPTCAPGCRVP